MYNFILHFYQEVIHTIGVSSLPVQFIFHIDQCLCHKRNRRTMQKNQENFRPLVEKSKIPNCFPTLSQFLLQIIINNDNIEENKKSPRSVRKGLKQRLLRDFICFLSLTYFLAAAACCAATSAAKSSSFFSIPSPTSKRTTLTRERSLFTVPRY